MITSTTGELKVDAIIQSEAVSQIVKTQTWADHATVIRKNHIGHIAVNTNFYDSDLCIENGARATQQMIPRCIITRDNLGRTIVPVTNLSDDDYEIKIGRYV